MCRPSVRPVSSSASHTGVYDGIVERRRRCTRWAARTPRPGPSSRMRGAPRRRLRRVLQRQRADALEAVGRDGAPLGDPVVVDRGTTPPRARGRGCRRASGRGRGTSPTTSMPSASSTFTRSCGVEAGGVAVLVVAAAGRSSRSSRPRCRGRRAPFGRPSCPRRGTRRSRSPRSSAAGCPRSPRSSRQAPLPEVGGLAEVPVGVDDVLVLGFTHVSRVRGVRHGVNRQPVIGHQR